MAEDCPDCGVSYIYSIVKEISGHTYNTKRISHECPPPLI